jgi:membrane protease YdiL (CAAX protease family)
MIESSPPWLDRARLAGSELALAFAGLVIGVLALVIVRSTGAVPELSEFVAGPAITAIAAGFYAWASRRAIPLSISVCVPPAGEPSTRSIVGTTLVCIALALGGSIVLGELLELVGVPVQEQSRILEIVAAAKSGEDRRTIVVLGISAVVLAPIAEEWLFRALLLRRLLAHVGRPFAYGASALGFAAIHGNPAGFVVYVWLGLVFAVAMERTGKVASPITVHLANNAFAFALLLFGDS